QGQPLLGTRASTEHAEAVAKVLADVSFDPLGRTLQWQPTQQEQGEGTECDDEQHGLPIAVVSASTADASVMREAATTLQAFGHPVVEVGDVGVAAIQRILH